MAPPVLRTVQDAAILLGPRFADCTAERLAAAYCDRSRALLGILVRDGSDAAVDLPVRDILSEALRLDAAGLVLAHCHPSGDPEPSAADIASTRRLHDAALGLEIRLHDHLVFADGLYRSFRAMGLL